MKFILTLALALICLSPGFAEDGVTDIDQALVESNGGFPYIIMGSGSYRLTSNLVLTEPGTAIEVISGYVAIDLNGFSIIGTGEFPKNASRKGALSATGIYADPTSTVAVSNGEISGFTAGIALLGGANNVKMVKVFDNLDTGMIVVAGNAKGKGVEDPSSGSVIEDCEVIGNNQGILADGTSITGTVAANNSGVGIYCIDPGGCVISDNVVASNGLAAIDCVNCTISNNKIQQSGSSAIFAESSLITGNTITLDDGDPWEADTTVGLSNNVVTGTGSKSASVVKGGGMTLYGGRVIGCNVVFGISFCPDYEIPL